MKCVCARISYPGTSWILSGYYPVNTDSKGLAVTAQSIMERGRDKQVRNPFNW
jgi:hypothetical protein